MAAIRIRYLKAALQDWVDSYAYYFDIEVDIAEKFEQEVKNGIKLIKQYPDSGAPLSGGLKRLGLQSYPISIIYKRVEEKDPQEILIVSIAHQKRKPGFWKNR